LCFWNIFISNIIDGLRVDAVSNMLYLDYGTRSKMAIRNSKGTNENLEAVSFLKSLDEPVFKTYPNVFVFLNRRLMKFIKLVFLN